MTLNSHQDIPSEGSALHLCAAAISNMSGVTRTYLGLLVYGLGSAGAQSGCQALGVSSEKQRISTIHQDRVSG